jgi:predicted ArsR family transcriptional regulator
VTLAESALRERGYEPAHQGPTTLRLRNCPYRLLAADAPELVCDMNQHYLSGFLDSLGAETVQALLAPRDGECCVELRG